MPIDLKEYICERIQKEILVDIGRRGIVINCEYYHRCFNKYAMKPTYVCSADFPENKTCLVIKLVAEERMKLVGKKLARK
jgi:hypothetical protein